MRENWNDNRYEPDPQAQPRPEWDTKPAPAGRGNTGFWKGLLAGLLAAALVAGLAAGVSLIRTRTSYAGDQTSGESVLDAETIEKVHLLEQYIDECYLDEDQLTEEQMESGIYKGLLEALGDPYSVYYTEEEYKSLTEQTSGEYGGIGAYIGTNQDTGYAIISGVFDGSPAAEAGLQAGDIFYKVDDEEVLGMTPDEIVSRVKGPENSSVHLTMIREGAADYIEADITRKIINAPTVNSEMIDERIGCLQISEFYNVTPGQFDQALAELRDQGAKGLIIDLRGNPGGTVTAVTEIAGRMLPEGLVFYMEEKDGKRTEYTCPGADFDMPLVVLVDGYSASASEILSGAIQDAGIGTIVGTQTFGKGIVQNIYPLDDGTAIKLTVAKYFTRNGQDIHKVGITPDVVVEFDSEAYQKDETDNQKDKAVEILTKELGG